MENKVIMLGYSTISSTAKREVVSMRFHQFTNGCLKNIEVLVFLNRVLGGFTGISDSGVSFRSGDETLWGEPWFQKLQYIFDIKTGVVHG